MITCSNCAFIDSDEDRFYRTDRGLHVCKICISIGPCSMYWDRSGVEITSQWGESFLKHYVVPAVLAWLRQYNVVGRVVRMWIDGYLELLVAFDSEDRLVLKLAGADNKSLKVYVRKSIDNKLFGD